jgi:hypothetical protein
MTVNDICKQVGHDGSQILWPELPDPQKRRAFHIQEMIDVAWSRGFCVSPIEGHPVSLVQHCNFRDTFTVPMLHGNMYRLNRYLELSQGVLTGLNLSGRRHAVAWDGQHILDPASGEAYERHLFQIETFWVLTRADLFGKFA